MDGHIKLNTWCFFNLKLFSLSTRVKKICYYFFSAEILIFESAQTTCRAKDGRASATQYELTRLRAECRTDREWRLKFTAGRVVQNGDSLSDSRFNSGLFLFWVSAQLSSASDYLSNRVTIMDYKHYFKAIFKLCHKLFLKFFANLCIINSKALIQSFSA